MITVDACGSQTSRSHDLMSFDCHRLGRGGGGVTQCTSFNAEALTDAKSTDARAAVVLFMFSEAINALLFGKAEREIAECLHYPDQDFYAAGESQSHSVPAVFQLPSSVPTTKVLKEYINKK